MSACAPPNESCAPPKRGLCPAEMKKIGAVGVQIEAEIGVWHRPIRNFCGLHRILQNFWEEDLFLFFIFLEVTYFRAEKQFEFLILAEKSL